MPEAVATDNGSGYINRSIVTALEALGVEHIICPPATPQYKPFIERAFGTMTRELSEMLPGYLGHSVGDAQKIRARAKKTTGRAEVVAELEPAELQTIINNWVDGVYHQRRHGKPGRIADYQMVVVTNAGSRRPLSRPPAARSLCVRWRA